jgi:hypothetical protein
LALASELFQCMFHNWFLQIISFLSWQKGIFHMPLSMVLGTLLHWWGKKLQQNISVLYEINFIPS